MQDVEIRIPGQDEKSFAPAMVAVPQESAPEKAPVAPPPVPQKPVEPPPVVEKPVIEVPEKTAEKAPEKAPEKPAKPVEKKPVPAKPVVSDEARRAAAILAGQSATPPAATGGAHVILIGAFSNEANVVNLRKKLGEQGIKTFTEPLASPQGTKTRVRAGPFPSREAADKALDKMKRIGVSGVVTPKP